MGTVAVDYIKNIAGTSVVPLKDYKSRIIQLVNEEYTAGEWNPNNTFTWVPGANKLFTPLRADSRICFRVRLPMAWSNAGHAITNFRFYINTSLMYWEGADAGTYYENAKLYEFDFPSWGTTQGQIGLQVRSHANDNNEIRFYRTYYWNGAQSTQTATGHMIIEERVNG